MFENDIWATPMIAPDLYIYVIFVRIKAIARSGDSEGFVHEVALNPIDANSPLIRMIDDPSRSVKIIARNKGGA